MGPELAVVRKILVRARELGVQGRSDAENMFDKLKNQWGWMGYTTKDLKRTQLKARLEALAYNWRGIYTQIGTGPTHREAITTRQALMEGVARQTEHARTVKMIKMNSVHGNAQRSSSLMSGISSYLRSFSEGAEQLDLTMR